MFNSYKDSAMRRFYISRRIIKRCTSALTPRGAYLVSDAILNSRPPAGSADSSHSSQVSVYVPGAKPLIDDVLLHQLRASLATEGT